MQFAILGPVRWRKDEDGADQPAGPLRRGLLALLVARHGTPVPAGTLLDALWGEPPTPGSLRRLQVQIHRLRATLDAPGRLEFTSGGYVLHVAEGELDADRFAALVARAGRHGPERAAATLREALALWRGTPFLGVELPALAPEIQRLDEQQLVAYEELYEAEVRCGRSASAVPELTELARRHPLRERLQALLVTALGASGRQADALAAYRRARSVLVAELGLEPGRELREAERRILAGEPQESAARRHVHPAPAQLPHPPAGFIGRDTELAHLDGLVGDDPPLIACLAGTAGVGKTALAVAWGHRAAHRFPDGQLYVDLRGYGPGRPVPSGDALAAFLRALGVDGAVVPAATEERAALFRSLVAPKRLLVLLDNARSAEQVRPLLPGGKDCRTLVTSRDTLAGLSVREGAHRIDLGRLTAEEARRLLGGLTAAEPGAAAELIDLCARLPLALRIAAERLRAQPAGTVAALVAELTDERARLDLLDAGDPHASVRTALAASYHHLEPAAARLFRLLGLYPGEDIGAAAAAALAGCNARRPLDALLRANLVEEPAAGRYRMHDLLRTYAAELAQSAETPREREAARTRLFAHAAGTAAWAAQLIDPLEVLPDRRPDGAPADYPAALRHLDTERANLIRIAESAADHGPEGITRALSLALCWYLDLGLHHDDGLRLHHRALDVATRRGDVTGQGAALRAIGMAEYRLQRHEDCVAHMERALSLHEVTGERLLLASSAGNLGAVHGYLGHGERAEQLLRRSAALYRELGRDVLAYRPLLHLGLLLRRRQRPDEAEGPLRAALRLTADHPPAQAHTLFGLAALCRDTGRHDEALGYARRAVALAREAGFPYLEGLALNRLGSVCRHLGRYAEALRHQRAALDLAVRTYNRPLRSMAHNGAGETHLAAGAPAQAERCHSAALDGPAYERARAHAGLAAVCEQLGARGEAGAHRARALALYEELRAPEAERLRGREAEGFRGREDERLRGREAEGFRGREDERLRGRSPRDGAGPGAPDATPPSTDSSPPPKAP
ncbi:tetratricopeptide repeat protein [Streptomyces sp. TRM66268-LWL]|uniref:Tetratricopeptide repeat protein n=1 Tax=Streptomyces polyasparticus TaxID=2767826 RepID=A0ABR7SG69_9ACTN|nr:BTAD domain-containing putative transcriptional regulator [Streptomyces polyasparticus]MBC9714393.1 tetratricopeptide repeat protein [Streptomyces polyasparticus]